MGGLNFLLRCNYDTNFFNDLPLFYKKILEFFNELKTLYSYDQKQELILFNNKDILVDGKPFFLSEWFRRKGILSINELLNETGNVLTFQEFRDKYSSESNFLQYYQVVSAIPKRLWSLAKCSDTINRSFFSQNDIFFLNESTQINLYKAKSKDFYNLFNLKIHTEDQTGPKRWSEKLSLKGTSTLTKSSLQITRNNFKNQICLKF